MAGMERTAFASVVRAPGLALRAGRVGVVMAGYGGLCLLGALTDRFRAPEVRLPGRRWVRLLTALGPSYIKIGQLLSSRRDLLPDEICDALGRLTDAAPPPHRARIERAVRRAYRTRPFPFAQFDWTPIASGSIATVHLARTPAGREVAVKVRRPGIDRVMRRDFSLTGLAMGLLGSLPTMRSMPFAVMHRQVGRALLRQLDFTAERESLGALRDNLASLPGVRIPAPIDELCAEGIVAMEYIGGLTRFTPGDLDADERRGAVRAILAAVYEMLFVDGLVHCDLHPGNLYFDRDARLVILDAGFVVRLPGPVRESFADFFINMAMGDGRTCARIVVESAERIAPDADLKGFRADLAGLVDETAGARSGEFSLARFAGRLFGLQRRYGIYPAPEFAFPLLSLLVVEGMIKTFDAEVDFQAEAVPVLRRRNTPREPVG